jgi:2-phosphoglycerate kinase
MTKPILLIGGTSGVGKTTIANAVMQKYGLDHRLGTGFIREIVRSETNAEKEPELFTFTFAGDPIKTLQSQAQRLEKAIQSCIDRAQREGTSLVIEGNHLLPALYHSQPSLLYLMLTGSHATLRSRYSTTTHTARILTSDDMDKICQLDTYLCDQARIHDVPIIQNHSVEHTLAEIDSLYGAKWK